MKKVPEDHERTQKMVRDLMEVTKCANELNNKLYKLERELFIKIMDGRTTGNSMLDFALVACNGAYDESVIYGQYEKLSHLPLNRHGQQIMVVQRTEYWNENKLFVIRNIFIAVLRNAEVQFNVKEQMLGIPVEAGYFECRENLKAELLTTEYRIVNEDQICTGPLHNGYCEIESVNINCDKGEHSVPFETVFDIELLPILSNDYPRINKEHGINSVELRKLYNLWVKLKSSNLLN